MVLLPIFKVTVFDGFVWIVSSAGHNDATIVVGGMVVVVMSGSVVDGTILQGLMVVASVVGV